MRGNGVRNPFRAFRDGRSRFLAWSGATMLPGFALVLLCASAFPAAARDETSRVLILHSFRHALPVNTDWYRGITRGFAGAPDLRIEIDIEAPDLSPSGGIDYVSNLLDIYRRKYHRPESKPHLIIPTYTPALSFLLEHGDDVFPGVPVVFLGADSRFVASRAMPPHYTGITSHRDIAGTLELALQVHPDARRVAVIVGSGGIDQAFARDARTAFQPYEGEIEFTWLQGLPIDELVEAVSTLPGPAIILYLIQLQDRTGKSYVPTSTVGTLSQAADLPIYGLWDTLLGHGIIGGRLATLEEDAVRAAKLGLRVLRGESPAAAPVLDRPQSSALFHGGELARWKIDEDDLPKGSRVVHRQPSAWEEHRVAIITAAGVIGLQVFLILALLRNRTTLKRTQASLRSEHDRRTHAEADALRSGARLARFSKERALGATVTTIAHEIAQPLIAIQNYAQAAKRRIRSGAGQIPKLSELLEKIEREASRTGDIIQHIRTLMTTDSARLQPVSVNAMLDRTMRVVRPGIETRGCKIALSPAAEHLAVQADELQIQLVLVNLLQNAEQSMRAMADQGDKIVSIETCQTDDQEVEFSVKDRGPGVPPDALENMFEPLYSGRGGGMGMGLAICKSIVEAHGGRIWHTPNNSRGATFRFTLRRATT